jgi:hypothetical protein
MQGISWLAERLFKETPDFFNNSRYVVACEDGKSVCPYSEGFRKIFSLNFIYFVFLIIEEQR